MRKSVGLEGFFIGTVSGQYWDIGLIWRISAGLRMFDGGFLRGCGLLTKKVKTNAQNGFLYVYTNV